MRFGSIQGPKFTGAESNGDKENLEQAIRDYSDAPWVFVPKCKYCGKPILGIRKGKPGDTYCCADCAGMVGPGPTEGYPHA